MKSFDSDCIDKEYQLQEINITQRASVIRYHVFLVLSYLVERLLPFSYDFGYLGTLVPKRNDWSVLQYYFGRTRSVDPKAGDKK